MFLQIQLTSGRGIWIGFVHLGLGLANIDIFWKGIKRQKSNTCYTQFSFLEWQPCHFFFERLLLVTFQTSFYGNFDFLGN